MSSSEYNESTDSKKVSLFRDFSPLLRSFIVCLEDFDIGKELGSGSYGQVYRGTHEPTGYECAIKMLFAKELDQEDFLLFNREIESLILCRHPFCLPIVGWTAFYPYSIITKYIPCGTLFDRLYEKKYRHTLKPTELSFIMYGIAAGMKHIHSLGIIHRDLKSLNILLDERMFPLISDFGLSRFVPEEGSLLTKDIGTLNWMAPELLDGQEYTDKVDVYAYAMILYEMVATKFPFQCQDDDNIVKFVKENKRPKLPSATPHKLANLIKRCWAKYPEDRPSFEEIVNELRKCGTLFDGTDVDIYKSYIKESDKEMSVLVQDGPKPPLYSEAAIQRAANAANVNQRPRFDRLSNYENQDYIENLSVCTKALNFENAQIFFSHLNKVIDKKEFRSKLPEVFDILKKAFSKKRSIVMAFSNSNILSKMPHPPDTYSIHVLEIIMIIVTLSHDSLTKEMVAYLDTSINYFTYKVFLILARSLIGFNSTEREWNVLDYLLDKSDLFLETIPKEYMKFIYYLLNIPNILKIKALDMRCIILNALKKNNDGTFEAYKISIHFFGNDYSIPPDIIVKHLGTNAFNKPAAQYILHQPYIKVTDELIVELLKRIEENEVAMVALLQMIFLRKTVSLIVFSVIEGILGKDSFRNISKARILIILCVRPKIREMLKNIDFIIRFISTLKESPFREEKEIGNQLSEILIT